MKPQTFHGATSREVLRKVKETLGEDALIVANREVAGRIEITAVRAAALEPPARAAEPQVVVSGTPGPDGLVQQLMAEMRAMKTSIQRELAGIALTERMRRDPARGAVMRSLLESGFSPALARDLLAAAPDAGDAGTVRQAVRGAIDQRLAIAEEEALVAHGGVYALIGPTGVGKTTTTAKLAARCVMRHGAGQVALLTTDAYRIGAHDQLRVYGRILGVPVHMVRSGADLEAVLGELRGRKTILIDTIGMSQRDRMVAEQAALLAGGGAQVKRLLLLNATSSTATLDDVVGAYGRGGVHGSIVTKLDEAVGVATVVDCLIRHGLTLNYVTDGQRVPENLHLPNRAALLQDALRPAAESAAHALDDDDLPLLAGAGVAHG